MLHTAKASNALDIRPKLRHHIFNSTGGRIGLVIQNIRHEPKLWDSLILK